MTDRCPSSVTLAQGRSPLAGILRLVTAPIDAKVLLAACSVLAFTPITFGYAVEHNILTSIEQSSTQILLIMLMVAIVARARIGFRWDTGTTVIIALCIGASQLLGVFHSPSVEKNFVMPMVFPLFLLLGPICRSLARRMRLEENGRYAGGVSNFLLGFFCLECVTRYALSPFVRVRLNLAELGVESIDADALYRYKQSVFFSDSNSVGLALLCLIAVLLVFRQYTSKGQIALAHALLIATLSRASIAAGVCQLMIYLLWRRRRWVLTAIIVFAPVLTLLMFAAYTSDGTQSIESIDRSLASKFLILQKMVSMYSQADALQRFVGIGVGNTQGVIGIAAHTLTATFTLELGIVGSVLITFYVWFLCRGSSKTFYLLVVPIILNGFSLILPSMPFFYVALGVLGVIKDSQSTAPPRRCLSLRFLRAPLWTLRATAPVSLKPNQT